MASSSLHDEFTCGICLDTMVDPVSLICGHSYCSHCTRHYFSVLHEERRRRPVCPSSCKLPSFTVPNVNVVLRAVIEANATACERVEQRRAELAVENRTEVLSGREMLSRRCYSPAARRRHETRAASPRRSVPARPPDPPDPRLHSRHCLVIFALGVLLAAAGEAGEGPRPTLPQEGSALSYRRFEPRSHFCALTIEAICAITVWRIPWARDHPTEVVVGELAGLMVGTFVGLAGSVGALAGVGVSALEIVRVSGLIFLLASGLVGGHVGCRLGEMAVSVLWTVILRCAGIRVDPVKDEGGLERLVSLGAGSLIGISSGAFIGGLVGGLVGGSLGLLIGSRKGNMGGHAAAGVLAGSHGGILLGLSLHVRVSKLVGNDEWTYEQGFVGVPEGIVGFFGIRYLWAHALPAISLGMLLALAAPRPGGAGWARELSLLGGSLLWRAGSLALEVAQTCTSETTSLAACVTSSLMNRR